ncbi:MAG: hypothetical protein ACLGI2_07295 [Acidimicrobiia bacterium]
MLEGAGTDAWTIVDAQGNLLLDGIDLPSVLPTAVSRKIVMFFGARWA